MCIEAYAGALLDGEGSIQVNNDRNCTLLVRFQMTDVEPLELIASRWKGNVLTMSRRTTGGRLIYLWAISGIHAISFLKDIEPWVLGKALQLKIALTYPAFAKGAYGGNGRAPLPQGTLPQRRMVGQQLRDARRAKD